MSYEIIHASITGSKKEAKERENEDSIKVDEENLVFLLGDGMGGRKVPKTASFLAVDYMNFELITLSKLLRTGEIEESEVQKHMKDLMLFTNGIISSAGMSNQILRTIKSKAVAIYEQSNIGTNKGFAEEIMAECDNILDMGQYSNDISGMGTTLEAALVYNHKVNFGHTGNGRMYKVTGKGELFKLTDEHVRYPDNKEELSELESTMIERKLGLISYIGGGAETQVDVGITELEPGDSFIMVTDGVSHTVAENELLYALGNFETTKETILKISEKPRWIAQAYADREGITYEKAVQDTAGKDNASFIIVKRN
ncbi:protein phosphatase 2C domain-containing protein [Candidatus Woesearchaeota archaeon]|nr:protein phosphatase 2C domain-containing protein [Candidatus Woesearchaeota archaeon]